MADPVALAPSHVIASCHLRDPTGGRPMRHSTLTVAVVLVLATFLASATAQPKYVLRLSSPVSKDHAFGRGAEKFRQLVADSTKGQVDVQVHHANALSPIREGLEMGLSALAWWTRSEEHTSELQSRSDLVCRLLL